MNETQKPKIPDPRRFGTAREVLEHCFPAHACHTVVAAKVEKENDREAIWMTCSCGTPFLLRHDTQTEESRILLSDLKYGLRLVLPLGKYQA
jgi:hypothetical protein